MRLSTLIISCFTSVAVNAQSGSDSLRMDSVMHNLPEVYVRGERPVARVGGSKITYDLPRLIEKRGIDNAYDAVKQLPGVVEMDDRLSLGGMGETTIILDGRVNTMTAEEMMSLLKRIPASRIEKAEVMYNAPAKMQVRGAVINVLLKQKTDDDSPLQGEAYLKWAQSHQAGFGERANLLYNRGKFSLDFMYQHSHGDDFSRTDEFSHHRLDDGSVHDIVTEETNRSNGYSHDYRIGADWLFSEKHRLGIVYNGEYGSKKVNQSMSGNVLGSMNIRHKTWLHNLAIDYQTAFGLKTGAEMTYYDNPEEQFLNSKLPTGALNYHVNNEQRVNRLKFFISQEHALKDNLNINYGAIYTSSTNNSRQEYRSLTSTTGHSPTSSYTRQSEDVVNVYAGFGMNCGKKLMLDASLAAEYYHSRNWNRWNIYPTLNITYLPRQGHVLQLGVSNNRYYPNYWAMTNFVTYSNGGYNEITGNPGLRPMKDYRLQLVYVLHSKYQFLAWLKHSDDHFTQSPYQRHDRLTVSYQHLNSDFQQQIGTQAVVPFKAGNRLDARLTLVGVWQRDKASRFHDLSFDRNIFFGMAGINSTVTLSAKPDITVSIDGMIRSKAIQTTYDLPASGNLDIGARWQFMNKRAILSLYCNDIFETSKINPRIDFMGQNLKMNFSCYREFGLSFTYRFGGYKEKKHEAVDKTRF
ncbi:MAG: outer membrane beta-barrel family protein [Prevotella sp.]|uniref:outer membrane beta-barrel family protein n=1 Tax=Prevotella sp. TaxID=59823 RepID=UPI002A2CEE30|nr:outer membrane beta-barrel family protein [Prevotella sp.]MDD7317806.1 outer membrane beta-barrel family protein [Prevotellaceae bacterium]MDY4020721.1 outer membrane beta-barrel family protein [Prevotella sp.]